MIKNKLLAVKASAGSGKTFRLANRYIALLLTAASPNNILAITFTNKAANEMRERILKFLNELGSNDEVVKSIAGELGLSEKAILQKKEYLIDKFLKNDINIQTIDSFLNKILRKFSFFAGFKNNFEIGSIEPSLVFKNFLLQMDEEVFKRFISLAKEEEKFINIVKLFESLYEKDKELKNIKFKHYEKPDDSKAKEMFNRLKSAVLDSDASPQAKRSFNIEFYDAYKTGWFAKDSLNYWHYKKIYEEWFDKALFVIKEYFKDWFNYYEYLFFSRLFEFYNGYKDQKKALKKEENILDFKDIEHLVYKLLREDEINRDFLYFRLDSRIDHILIDEFQDTSITQWEIFEPFLEEIKSGIGTRANRSFFYVGDPKQAIYRFRGGQKELFDVVAKKHNMQIQTLKKNFRSDKEIVNFVNEKFGLNEEVYSTLSGYVEVDEITKENALGVLYEKIEMLNKAGVKDSDIAVLVYKNDEILEVGEFLRQKSKDVLTAKKAKVTSRPFAKAVISLMKYLNNPDLKIEKLNFLSLIGREWSEEEFDIEIKRPVEMIKEIMQKYDLSDESTLKLLYHSKKYPTLIDFVANIDKYDEELPLSQMNGITVMTIHKSKGLEFEHVIVLDRLSKENPDRSNIYYHYENAKLKNIKLKIKNREFIDPEYKEVAENEKRLQYEDKKNVEYVAFTRAKHSLVILKRSEVKKDGSSYSAFVTPLEKMKKGEIIPGKKEPKQNITPLNIKLKNFGTQEVKIKDEEYKPNDYEAIYLGDAIHYMFECMDIEAVRNRYGDFCDIDLVKNMVDVSLPKLPKGKKEVPFIYNMKIGRIDLLVEDKDGYLIIDYKSTTPHDPSAYYKQVREYVKAVEAITGKKAKGKLFYVDKLEFKEV
ncbi:MAG: RecB-like helicase [Epsilonproteobacteria bacterium]|nr:RecB-like helicase [Campylobacterota bacterium]